MKKESDLITSLQKASLDKGRSKFFFTFLLLSFVFWFITKFSKEYTEVIQLEMSLDEVPLSIIPILSSELQIEATLKATGFQFLYYQLIDNKLKVDVENATFESGQAILPLSSQFQELQDQLLGDTQILNLYPTNLEFEYQVQASKRVPIMPPKFNLAIGYAVTQIHFEPDSIDVIGPEETINSIESYTPIWTSRQKIQKRIKQYLRISPTDKTLTYDRKRILMEIEVDQFSETQFTRPIATQNIPEGRVYKFFPNQVVITFSAPLSQLKTIQPEDFSIGIDFEEVSETENKFILKLLEAPDRAKNIRWEPKSVDYLIRQ
ncbi:MAG: hypothetical protein ACPH63_02185 [Flavobacteriaceae bacterium]